ncbi:UDP-D-xylose:L-fucose alpha-1,3-D-xylosyltransferase 3 [Holothuria leucospilota]|uniref:UDP-D-xylose:L-fucose alpha-1,3-D-xylosyltransferase 3 n=1 Tax=Holothuria leucospilota TaxID=206669 RepID=A0A9Q1HA45_HOLLE|nr:UDP-D-xylose:L-fucose alpha-1,3-D-xylosyltransferase 3 [Holothuria leucospilota]
MLALFLLTLMLGAHTVALNDCNVADQFENSCNSVKMKRLSDIIPQLTSPVVVTMANMGYAGMADNLLTSIERVNCKPTVVLVCEDELIYERFQDRDGVHVVLTEFERDLTEAQAFLSDGFKDLAKRRIWYVLRLLEAGLDTLYLDADTVWLQDPFPYFDGNFDLYVQQEEKIPYCSGMFFVKATEPSLRMVRYWKEHVHEGEGLQDQVVYNEAIRMTADLKLKGLPDLKFCGGEIYFKSITPWQERKTKPVIVHATWQVGVPNKINKLKECGLWFVD